MTKKKTEIDVEIDVVPGERDGQTDEAEWLNGKVYLDVWMGRYHISGWVSPQVARLVKAAPDLLALARQYASECAECNGTGVRMAHPAGATADCSACADIRAVIARATGEQQ